MAEQKTEMENKAIVRYSNEESKRITRDCIETALMMLLEKKEFESISISEIVKRAGVSRTAFYRNYQSKEDVLISALGDAISRITGAMSLNPHTRMFWQVLFQETKEYLHPFQLLLKAGFGATILEQITEYVLAGREGCSVEEYYSGILWAGAVYNVLVEWVKGDAEESIDTMTELCMTIANNLISREA